MTLVRYFPRVPAWQYFNRMTDADRLFDEMNTQAAGEWSPRADVVEGQDRYEIDVELPGLKREDVKVEVENGVLTVSGETKAEHEDQGKGVYRLERRYGTFTRSFELPEGVDASKINATFRNGVLKVAIPKAPEVAPRKVEIHE